MSATAQTGADKMRQQAAERKREEKKERIEVHGKAKELFDARSRDSFTLERHGVEIEFLYPDPETRERFEERQERVLESVQDGANILELVQEAQVGLDTMCETLSDHAVDPSFHDPDVWQDGLGFSDDEVSELHQDFMELGEGENRSRTLEQLQTLISDKK